MAALRWAIYSDLMLDFVAAVAELWLTFNVYAGSEAH